jgi:hypothetical protein
LETYDEGSPTFFLIEMIATFVPDQDVLDQSLPMAEEANICDRNSGPHIFLLCGILQSPEE